MCNVNHPILGWVWPEVNKAKNQTEQEIKWELPRWEEEKKDKSEGG